MEVSISSADFVQTNGFGLRFLTSMYSRIERSSSSVLRCAERRSCLLVSEVGEEAFDLVDPRRAFRREVHVKARTSQQPALDQRRLLGVIVVKDEVDLEFLRDVLVDRVEKPPKLDAPVTSVMLSDDPAALDVQRSEERSGAVPDVVVGSTLDLSGTQRQDRLGAVESLYLRLLVHAQNDSAIGRIQIQADDVAYFDEDASQTPAKSGRCCYG
jgi:hypothetical protein